MQTNQTPALFWSINFKLHPLLSKMFAARQLVANCVADIRSMIQDHLTFIKAPRNTFTQNGYEVIPSFLDREECDRLIKLTDSYLSEESYAIDNDCYVVCRKDIKDRSMDKSVQQIINAQTIDPNLNQLFSSGTLESLFERSIGQPVKLRSITVQVDNIDTKTKRGYHADGVTPTTYKAFIYLNDVKEYGEGPYTIIPGSHKHILRRILNYLYICILELLTKNSKYKHKKDDRGLFYSDRGARSIFAEAGTLILSNQQLTHKGWHHQDKQKRYALICFISLASKTKGEFKLWHNDINWRK